MTLQKTLEFYNINIIWHFTDNSNYSSIKKHGLLSLNLIEKYDIDVSCFGGNSLSHDLDKRYGLDKYVHLSFIKEHPMCYTKSKNGDIPNPIWIAIDASVLFSKNVYFSTDIANKTGIPRYKIDQLEQQADIEVLWGKTDWSDSVIKNRRKSAKRGELLIPKMIKPQDILGAA